METRIRWGAQPPVRSWAPKETGIRWGVQPPGHRNGGLSGLPGWVPPGLPGRGSVRVPGMGVRRGYQDGGLPQLPG
eukprot:10407302-Lingulodinium_polyedra.AAC.1